MPGGFPFREDLCNAIGYGTDASVSAGTLVTANVSANTKGSYSQLIAATTVDAAWIMVELEAYSGSGIGDAVDIAIGAGGSEIVLIPNLRLDTAGNNTYGSAFYFLPISIPAGTRIAARSQASTGSDGIHVEIHLFDAAFTSLDGNAGVDALGFLSASTLGTQIDPGGTANTKGSYAEIIASTANDYCGVFFHLDTQGQAANSNLSVLLDIAVGAAASEKNILPNLQCAYFSANPIIQFVPQSSPFIPICIPAGTRLSARCQSTSNNASFRKIGITLYGVYQ